MECELDHLYGLPPDEFVAARDELARRLRREGDRGGADGVAALRKPPVAAWAANQAVRHDQKAAARLLAASDRAVAAQQALVAGTGEADELRAAVEEQAEAVDELRAAAADALRAAGKPASESTLDRVARTLRAAPLDAEARAAVERGRLATEVEHAGLGPEAAFAPAAPRAGARPAPKRDRRERAEAKLRERELRERVGELRQAAREADRAAAVARRAAEAAEKDAAQERERLDAAEVELEELRSRK